MDNDDSPGLRALREIVFGVRPGVAARRGSQTVLGVSDIRDLSEGKLPAEVYRIHVSDSGVRREEFWGAPRTTSGVERMVKTAGKGWTSTDAESWIEIRAPRTSSADSIVLQ